MHQFTFESLQIDDLTTGIILRHSPEMPDTSKRGYFDLHPTEIELNFASFNMGMPDPQNVLVEQGAGFVKFSCSCDGLKGKPCLHEIRVLYNLNQRRDLRAFFDTKMRRQLMAQASSDFGLQDNPDLDHYFRLEYEYKIAVVKPKLTHLMPVNKETIGEVAEELVPKSVSRVPKELETEDTLTQIVVFAHHKYYDHFYLELLEGAQTKEGKIKNPLKTLDPQEFIWKTEVPEELRFYSALAGFGNHFRKPNESDLLRMASLVRNPRNLPFYYHLPAVSESLTANSISSVQVRESAIDFEIAVDHKDNFYEIYAHLILEGRSFNVEHINLSFAFFILNGNTLFFVRDPDVLRAITFFRKWNNRILLHESKFDSFRESILAKLESRVRIVYSFLKPATHEQLTETGFDVKPEKLLYIGEAGNYVTLTPTMKYGQSEVSVFSREVIYSIDQHGNPFTVARNGEEELRFQSAVMRMHPDFQDQLEGGEFFLHKKSFLDENWFLDAFEAWQHDGIKILGFNKLTSNRINLHKAKVSVHVESGINWFNTTLSVTFGKQKATLKSLHKAIRNRSRYVSLDDGTEGILPQEWLTRFAKYFAAAEKISDQIYTPRIRFQLIDELYEAEMLGDDVRTQLKLLNEKFRQFDSIIPVSTPEGLKTELRKYQQEGLSWLNFLDESGFGGCLADDMGLGKTVQILAFILSQQTKQIQNTNLIVVPTSLIFNWQAEAERFAPSLRILTIYGNTRVRDTTSFEQYEIILTTYGTLLTDVTFLKTFAFNYVFLDESQAIKNPESQRYKAVNLLRSRNRIAMTGTPVENNTFDIYAQLSFACPGLLGTKNHFRNHFSIPIDQFHDAERAQELQRRIHPFVLRRTKKQVAHELPDKTEMVLFCEMNADQRRIYNAYEHEFRVFLNNAMSIDLDKDRMHVLQGLTKLRQICNAPSLLNDEQYYGDSSAKIDVLMEQLESKYQQHKILIFSQFVSMLDLIRPELDKRGIGYEYLTGQTRNREQRVKNFQENENVRVFLISLKAGGTGLNLTEADYVYLVDPWWNPAVENQAIDRSYRIGQKKNVIAVRLICPDTIEEKIMKLQDSKKDLADGLIRTDASILKKLTRDDLLALIQ